MTTCTWICIFSLIYRWLRIIACFVRSQLLYYYIFKTLRFKSEQRTIIYIILVRFCLYISLFVNVFQIHSIVMLLFGIIVITYVFHLFIWFISTHWQYRVRNVSTNYMYMKHFDWYKRTVLSNLKNPYNILHFLHFMISVFGWHNGDWKRIWDVAHATTDERHYHSWSCAFPWEVEENVMFNCLYLLNQSRCGFYAF